MARVVVLTTGGTIASRTDADGSRRASATGQDLLAGVQLGRDIEVEVRDVLCIGSYAMTPADMRDVLDAVHLALADPDVAGVVVTHGTDTIEETALLVDVFHADPRPVVFTGAQRPADSPHADGPLNLRDAICVAADPKVRGLGALVVFAGLVLAARGTRKVDTLALVAFDAPHTGPVGRVVDGDLHVLARPLRPAHLDLAALDLHDVRVDVVALYPGADPTAVDAHVAAGARGLVLEATGLGNANSAVVASVADLTARGIAVVLSTRVHAGPVLGVYGNGGGSDLVAAGAVSAGLLRPSQARMLLLALLGTGADADGIRTGFATDQR